MIGYKAASHENFPPESFRLLSSLLLTEANNTRMRKTRLVILPTKCLHQMGFLLLFLSCPVIGDWGRIRPDNENLQRAIDVEREGTCGLQRDTPGGFLHFTDEKESNVRRFREDNDLSLHRMSQNRLNERRRERLVEFRRRRDVEERSVRSRSAETRRNNSNDIRVRSLSLSRLEAARRQTRTDINLEGRDNVRRLSLAKMNERRVEQRESERITPIENERSRLSRRRENENSVQRLSLKRREGESRRQKRNNREETQRRLSLSRMEEDSRKFQCSEGRRTADRATLEMRLPEVKKSRNERQRIVRMERDVNSRREVDKKEVAITSGQNLWGERRGEVLNRRAERLEKTRRMSPSVNHQVVYPEDKTGGFFTEAMKWLNLENHETLKIGDWSSTCVMGAVAYYLSTRQTKTV